MASLKRLTGSIKQTTITESVTTVTYVPWNDERTEDQAEADAADLQWMKDHDTRYADDPAPNEYAAPVASCAAAH